MVNGYGNIETPINEVRPDTFVRLLDVNGGKIAGTVIANYPTYFVFQLEGDNTVSNVMHDVIASVTGRV